MLFLPKCSTELAKMLLLEHGSIMETQISLKKWFVGVLFCFY